MKYLLVPGRHHLITRFQIEYLRGLREKYDTATIVWAVTSADHTGTQRNPLPGSRRLGMIEAVVASESLPSEVYLIANRRQSSHFAHYLIEDIRTQTGGRVAMNPGNTIVACSTPAVIEDYRALGYRVETIELDTTQLRPWNIVEAIIGAHAEWSDAPEVVSLMHPASQSYYEQYHLAEYIQAIYADPLVGSGDGDITATRDYVAYRAAFEDNAWRKVELFADYVRPGRIVDVGCATGQTIKLLGEKPEFFESDFYGVEVARPLYEICQQRKTNGEFGDTNVYFYQRNIMQSELFWLNSLDTVITMALTHEIESYLGHEELERFLKRTYEMLAPNGVYINFDVVGPDDPDQEVYVQFAADDGENPDDLGWGLEGEALTQHLDTMSTSSRFQRFMKDFRHDEGDTIQTKTAHIDGVAYTVMRHGDLCDFLAKKDYTKSWKSEMHERFCFYSHASWCQALEAVGFQIKEGTQAIQNPWLIEHRFRPAANVFVMQEGRLAPLDQPVTNTLLICEKITED